MAEQDSTEERVTSGAMEENICYSTLTSFLQKDNSFLTPWSWDPSALENEASTSTKQKEYLQFPPGSYFSYSMFRCLKERKKPRNYDHLRIASERKKKMMELRARIKKKLSLLN